MTCTTARSVDAIGDPWTLMILKELFVGTRKFEEFLAMTGMSPHLLSMRMRKLQKNRIVERKLYQKKPRRYEYKLTRKGVDIWPIMVALKEFSDRWTEWPNGPPLKVSHTGCGHRIVTRMVCERCGGVVPAWDATVTLSKEMAAERREMSEDFYRKIRRA